MRELGSARVLELGFNKITILPLKMSKLTKQGLFMFRSGIQIPAGTRPVRPVFLPVRNIGVNHTGLLAGMVYSGSTGRYGTVLTTLVPLACKPAYPYTDFPPINDIVSLLRGRSISWGIEPRINSYEFTELNYLYL